MSGRNTGVRLFQVLSAVTLMVAALVFLEACQVRTPGSLETKFIDGAKRRITIGGRSDVNPLATTEENIRSGRQNFTSYCMVCHGFDGQNTGVPFADKMSPPVPPLSSSAVQAYADGQLHWIIQNGISPSGMPAAKDIFRDEEIWQMVLYIRHLPPKGSLGEPPVYGGETKPRGTGTAKEKKSGYGSRTSALR
jgi:mono/diheme cytochrome c family protein